MLGWDMELGSGADMELGYRYEVCVWMVDTRIYCTSVYSFSSSVMVLAEGILLHLRFLGYILFSRPLFERVSSKEPQEGFQPR